LDGKGPWLSISHNDALAESVRQIVRGTDSAAVKR
jgi:hypothetical protein